MNEDEVPVDFGADHDVAMRLSAEDRARRPVDQPTGELASIEWAVTGMGGVVIENLGDLYSEGYCADCLIPVGARTRKKLQVRFEDAQSRRYDGVMAQLPERPKGPTYGLFTERFVEVMLTAPERREFGWRHVRISNPTKITMPLLEPVRAKLVVPIVALRGGAPDVERCATCHRSSEPRYPLAGSLPDWLNPRNLLSWDGQPDTYIAAEALRDPRPPWFAFGEWVRGVKLAVSDHRHGYTGRPKQGAKAIALSQVGAVAAHLVDRNFR